MIQVTCALIISEDGKVLLAQNREDSDHPMQWEFPGGKVKEGETGEKCILREIKEELDVDVEIVEALNAIEHDYGIKKIRLIPFVCKVGSGIIRLNNHIRTEWVVLQKVNEFDLSEADRQLIELPANQDILEKYIRK